MPKVLVLIDRDPRGRTVRRSACALLTLARRLGDPVAVVGGERPDDEAIRTLGRFGATEIWCLGNVTGIETASASSTEPGEFAGASADSVTGAVEHSPGEQLLARARAEAITGAVEGSLGRQASARAATDTDLLQHLAVLLEPAAILIPATPNSQETAARLAVRLDSGIITNAIDVRPGPVAVQRCLAGSYLVESSVVRGVPIITVRPEAAVPEPQPATPSLHAVEVLPSQAPAPRIVATPKPRLDRPPLDQADIVVAGGRGIGSRAAFAVLAEVADTLGAALAGSHTAAELGWVPREAQVGLTGTTVHPRLYLACGVSGSVRHRAGMQGAKTVVVIGDDPDAPIFKLADLGVVGDAQTILPALLKEIRARTGRDMP